MRLHNQYPNTFTHTTPLVKEPSPFNRTIKNLVKYSFYGLHHLTQLNLIAPPVLCTQGTVSPLCLPASLRFVFVVGPLARSTGPTAGDTGLAHTLPLSAYFSSYPFLLPLFTAGHCPAGVAAP